MPRRRDVLKFAAASLTLLVSRVGAGATAGSSILAVRVWPARDYTRVTLEHDQAIRYSHLLVKDPERLVLDLEGVEFNSVLQMLPSKIIEADPYIRLIRAGTEVEPATLAPMFLSAAFVILAIGAAFSKLIFTALLVLLAIYLSLAAWCACLKWRDEKDLKALLIFFLIPGMHLIYGLAQWGELVFPGRDLSLKK